MYIVAVTAVVSYD